jgi:hypothetical protein
VDSKPTVSSPPPPVPEKPQTLRPKTKKREDSDAPEPASPENSDASMLPAPQQQYSRPNSESVRLTTRFEAKDLALKEDNFYRAVVQFPFTAESTGEISVEKGLSHSLIDVVRSEFAVIDVEIVFLQERR